MTDLLKKPYSKAEDLGKPIPDSLHATSVCMPKWADNVDYEKGDARVTNDLTCGYPRFIYHPLIKELVAKYSGDFTRAGEECLPFPSRAVAEKCQHYIKQKENRDSKIYELGINKICLVTFPDKCSQTVKDFWEHSGEIVSSRHANATLNSVVASREEENTEKILKNRIAQLSGSDEDDVYLFPSGMAAIFNIYSAWQYLFPNRKSTQFGFPYVDTLKIQQKFGCGVNFYSGGDAEEYRRLEADLKHSPVMALFCEFPMNPLLRCPDLQKLSILANEFDFPIVIDDTISTFVNASVLSVSDVTVSSLTKFFSGFGDVMGGCAILNKKKKHYPLIKDYLNQNYENNLWVGDCAALEKNSRGFVQRMQKINSTTETLCDKLSEHPMIQTVYYPKFQTRNCYVNYKKEGGGYSGLFSFIVKNPEVNTEIVFDKLDISKGPSLGTCFSLACPYTILAHFNELNFAKESGVSQYLIRVSVGLEDADDLINRFFSALSDLEDCSILS